MGIVTLDDVKPGMVLACDLFGSNGRFLMPEGAVIEDKHLRIFKIWGVAEVDVQENGDGESCASDSGIDPAIREKSESMIEPVFRLAGLDHPAIQELRKIAIVRGARMIAAGEVPERYESQEVGDEASLERPPSIAGLLDRQTRLSSYPDIYMRIVEVLNNPRSSAAHIAEVVGKDAGISAKLLRLVNSPFYGFPTRIDSLSRAVALIGANDLTTLALGISVVNHFKGVPDKLVDMKSFWLHSIACGVLARLFANKKIGLNEERFFVAGLLHDIAKLVLYQDLPEHMGKVLAKARMNSSCQFEIEKESMGFDHARLAETLLSEWKLPVPLQRMIRYHHSPPSGAGGLDSAIIHLADISAIGLMYGTSGQVTVPPLNTQAWDILEFGPGTISAAARQAERQIREIIKIFMR